MFKITLGVVMKYLAVLLISVLSLPVQSNANEEILDALAIAKFTGLCGALKQLAAFQEATKMQGGDDLVLRFMTTEAARLGMDLSTFLNTCITNVDMYNEYVKALNSNE